MKNHLITSSSDPRLEPDTERRTDELILRNVQISNDDDVKLKVNIFFSWEDTPDGLVVEECRVQFLTMDRISKRILRDECIDQFYWAMAGDTKWFKTEEIKIVNEI